MKRISHKWKKGLGLVLALVMTAGLNPVMPGGANQVQAAETGTGHSHYLCGGDTCNHVGGHQEDNTTTFEKEIKQYSAGSMYIGDQKWTEDSKVYVLSEGTYYLSTDLKLDYSIQIMGNVTLCLNGNTITIESKYGEVNVIEVGKNGSPATLTLTDCKAGNSDSGQIMHVTGNTGRGVYIENQSTFNMYGGDITGNSTSNCGCGVYIGQQSTFNMYDGNITDNSTTANYGGGVYMWATGIFHMYGGSITNNNASNNTEGGGVYVDGYPDTKFTVSGDAVIKNNWKNATKDSDGQYTGGIANNVYLQINTKKRNAAVIYIDNQLKNGASIGVTLDSNYGDGPFTSGWNEKMGSATPSDYFISDDSSKKAANYGLELQLVSAHEHNWTYALKAGTSDTITATCASCPNNSGNDFVSTATISAPASLIYDGSEKTANVTKSSDFLDAATSVTYSKSGDASFSGTPIDAGTYTANLTINGITASVNYTIGKAAQSAPIGLSTEGAGIDVGNGKLLGTSANMEYNTSADAASGWISCTEGSTELAPGTYYVRYKETDNYNAGAVSGALTVDAHIHSGGTATCANKAICSVCGFEYGEFGDHNYIEKVDEDYLISAATCVSKAVYKKSCSVCGRTDTETFESGELDANNHKNTEIRNARPATEQEKGYTGDTWCTDCNQEIAKGTETDKFAPKIIEGDNAVTSKGEKKTLSFRSNAAFADFVRVELDGVTLGEENYTKKEGSTIVTLNEDFVSTLAGGEHTLGIVSQGGTATAKFTVSAAVNPAPTPTPTPTPNQTPTAPTTPTTPNQTPTTPATPATPATPSVSATTTTPMTDTTVSDTPQSLTSPKTSENDMTTVLFVIMILALLGATVVVYSKKRVW